MPVARVGLLVAASLAAPTFIFEPHLKSSVNREAIEQHEMGMLSQLAQAGAEIYKADCMGCHGEKGVGTGLGPTLWRAEYRNGGRVQKRFHMAVKEGNDKQGGTHRGLPATKLSFNDLETVARYVREVWAYERRRERSASLR